MNSIKLFLLFIIVYSLSLPSYAIFTYGKTNYPKDTVYEKYSNIDNAKKSAFTNKPIKTIDMTPYKDFLIDSDYIEIMKLMKEEKLYKTLLKDNPFHIFLCEDNSKNIYAYGKYYINNRNVVFIYSMSGELININISNHNVYPSPIYTYSNKGELIEIVFFDNRFKPNGDFIGYINGSVNHFNKRKYLNINNTKEEKTENNLNNHSFHSQSPDNTEIIFSQGRKNSNFLNFLGNTKYEEDKNIIKRIVFPDYNIFTDNYPSPAPEAPFYDVNTARNHVLQGEQPPQTIDMSKYKDYITDKNRNKSIEYISTVVKSPNEFIGQNNKFRVKGFYNFDLFTGYYAKQFEKSNEVFYYNIKGELQKIEIRPKETAYGYFVKKIPDFPLKSYFYSPDGKLMFINLIMNEYDCYLFKPNSDFYSLWIVSKELDINMTETGLMISL